MALNRKGQAAITDALYFLLVIMGLVVFLFFFSNQYGASMASYMSSTYISDYANSALKTILYSSSPRILGETIDDANEVEFLMTLVKEDYAVDQELDFSKPRLTNNIVSIMKPLSKSYNYIFYIINTKATTQKAIYVLAHVTKYTIGTDEGISPTTITAEEKTYYCTKEDLEKSDIDVFALRVGVSGKAVHKIQMTRIEGKDLTIGIGDESLVGIILWIPTKLEGKEEWEDLECETEINLEPDLEP